MAFAGLSYGQTISGCVLATAGTSPVNPSLRAEGETELVADATLTCSATAATTGSVYASLSLPVTSKSVSPTSTYVGNSDAVLQVLVGSVFLGAYPGTVTGSTVSFSGVSYPAGTFTLQVSNIRVNASTGGNPQVTESVLAQYSGPGTISQNAVATNVGSVNVGYVLPSLNVSLYQNANLQNLFYGGTSTSFGTCTGEPLSNSNAPTPAFTLLLKEVFAGAFKTAPQEAGSLQGTLGGATVGASTQATQLQVALTGIPSAATIYLPISVTSGGTTLSLQGSVSPLTSPNSLVGLPLNGAGALTGTATGPGVFGFTPSGGAVTAIYSVTANTLTGTTFTLPVYLTVAGGAAPVNATAMTVAVTYTPTAALTGPASLIPTFAASTASINTLTVSACTTSLLFPFITNVSGFETGLAIANTTTDNLGKNGASSASPTTGTCTISFYGNGATNPAAFTTTALGAYSASPAAAPVYANVLTSMAGANFTGYAIATCNFNDAHGFGYIVDNFGQTNGTAQGFVAIVLPSNRSSGSDATPNNATPGLGN